MVEKIQILRPDIHLEMTDVPEGILVSQRGRKYIARGWHLTQEVASIVELALNEGLQCLIQNGHPSESKLLPNGDGTDYLTFSDKPEHRWTFVLNMDSCPDRANPVQVTFNKKFKHVLRMNSINCPPQWRSPQELVVAIEDLPSALRLTKPFWSQLGKKRGIGSERGKHGFFVDEEDLHSEIVQNWQAFDLADNLEFVSSKHLIGSPNNRMGEVDVLAKDTKGNVYVIELKNNAVRNAGGETPDQQLSRYMAHSEIRKIAEAHGGYVQGILIAQDIDQKLRNVIRESELPIIAYEATKANNRVVLQEVSRSSRYIAPRA